MLDVIIIGAGPYGISVAAHAVAKKLSYKLFGYPMDFWKNRMPQNMFIRTPHDLVSFSDPRRELTIQNFASATNTKIVSPLPRTVFVSYAFWFAEKSGITFTPELIQTLSREDGFYSVVTEGGERFDARNIVIATGIKDFKYIPDQFNVLPSTLVSHTLGFTSFEQFRNKEIVVYGSGQSAWEAAALLRQEKAKVHLVFRAKAPVYGGNRLQEVVLKGIGNMFYQLPGIFKKKLWQIASATVPIAHFLKSYVEGKVPQMNGVSIVQADEVDGKVRLKLSSGMEMEADHVIVASGFKINMNRLSFLDSWLLSEIEREEGLEQFPKLNKNFESSSKGLYFAGPLSSRSHGPTFQFILGLEKTAKTIIKAIQDDNRMIQR